MSDVIMHDKKTEEFSVLMSLYCNENLNFKSMLNKYP